MSNPKNIFKFLDTTTTREYIYYMFKKLQRIDRIKHEQN